MTTTPGPTKPSVVPSNPNIEFNRSQMIRITMIQVRGDTECGQHEHLHPNTRLCKKIMMVIRFRSMEDLGPKQEKTAGWELVRLLRFDVNQDEQVGDNDHVDNSGNDDDGKDKGCNNGDRHEIFSGRLKNLASLRRMFRLWNHFNLYSLSFLSSKTLTTILTKKFQSGRRQPLWGGQPYCLAHRELGEHDWNCEFPFSWWHDDVKPILNWGESDKPQSSYNRWWLWPAMWVTRPKKTQSVRINVIINNDKFTNIFIKIILINYTGTISKAEAREALRKHKGNIWASVTECVEGRQQKVMILKMLLVMIMLLVRMMMIGLGSRSPLRAGRRLWWSHRSWWRDCSVGGYNNECDEGRQQKVVILMTMLVVTIMSMRLVVIIIGFMNKEDMLMVLAVSCISRQYLTMTSLQ